MSVKGKKAGLVISWQRSLSILAPWRKGKGSREAILDSEVVLTKMKLFSNFHQRLLISDDSASTVSTVSVFERDISDSTKASEVNSNCTNKSGQPQTGSSSNYLSSIFSDPQLSRLYKFESEDSGVELPSGANSPSTPTGSEQSFVVHSRESSCDSCNSTSDPTTLTDKLVTYAPNSESEETAKAPNDHLSTTANTQDDVFVHSEELNTSTIVLDLHIDEDVEMNQCRASGSSAEADDEMSGQLEGNSLVTDTNGLYHTRKYGSQTLSETCDDITDHKSEQELVPSSATSDSLEKYMDECCRLSKQASSNPLCSGLGYLEHICQLLEKISQLQETNLHLQRQICCLQKDGSVTKTKEDFFQKHCSCGAARLAFQDVHKISPSGTLYDLSTIPEFTRHPLISSQRDLASESLAPVPSWRRGQNRRSYTEGEVRFLGDSTDGLSLPQRRLSDNYTWGRVRDLVRKTKLRNQSRLGLTSASLKMSCPQLYMPDGGPAEPARKNRSSMIVLDQQRKLDFL